MLASRSWTLQLTYPSVLPTHALIAPFFRPEPSPQQASVALMEVSSVASPREEHFQGRILLSPSTQLTDPHGMPRAISRNLPWMRAARLTHGSHTWSSRQTAD